MALQLVKMPGTRNTLPTGCSFTQIDRLRAKAPTAKVGITILNTTIWSSRRVVISLLIAARNRFLISFILCFRHIFKNGFAFHLANVPSVPHAAYCWRNMVLLKVQCAIRPAVYVF
jgi:hypothetical protein